MLSCAVQTFTLPWQSADGISSNNEAYLIHLTPQFQFLTFTTALSGSGTKCGVVRDLWNGFLQQAESSNTWECLTHLLLDPMCNVVMARCRWFEEDLGSEVALRFIAHVQAESSTMLGSTVDTCSCVSPSMILASRPSRCRVLS